MPKDTLLTNNRFCRMPERTPLINRCAISRSRYAWCVAIYSRIFRYFCSRIAGRETAQNSRANARSNTLMRFSVLRHSIKFTVFVVGVLLGAACSNAPHSPLGDQARRAPIERVASDKESCNTSIKESIDRQIPALASTTIKLLVWNVFKEQRERWDDDWRLLAQDKHLVLLQEAVHGSQSASVSGELSHWAFAPGYRTSDKLTGVATGSQVPPLVECRLANVEPWLRTPKASLITQYPLVGSDQRLLVANVHAINFSFGVAAFAKQLKQLKEVMSRHRGPVILAGDFNTWNPRRMAILERIARQLRLDPVQFSVDRRRTVFNRPVSHIYTRGLRLNDSTTQAVMTSDHNPIVAEFSVEL